MNCPSKRQYSVEEKQLLLKDGPRACSECTGNTAAWYAALMYSVSTLKRVEARIRLKQESSGELGKDDLKLTETFATSVKKDLEELDILYNQSLSQEERCYFAAKDLFDRLCGL